MSGISNILDEEENNSLLNDFISGNSTSNPNDIGKLQSEISATVHTKHAATLIAGKVSNIPEKGGQTKSRGVIGLYKFASIAATMEVSIKKDDPFADYIFYNLHEEIILARKDMEEKTAHYTKWVKGKIPASLNLSESVNVLPLKMDLKFNSSMAFQLTYLILEADKLFRLVKLAQHITIVDSAQANTSINEEMRNIRRIMNTVYLYKVTNATRKDQRQNNQVWARACEAMPNIVIPEEFLSAEKRSALAPYIAIRPEDEKPEMVKIPEAVA
jgi:integrating conjugative element protein (TIGR03761 family)